MDAIEWLAKHYPETSYAVHAHIERQGAYVRTEDRSYNVDHIRDWHNAGLLDPSNPQGESVAFGIESQPGHAFAGEARGTYAARRPSACFWTYGGTGCYTAAEASLPGKHFDGSDLTDADLAALKDQFNAESPLQQDLNVTAPKERYVLGRPGVRTMWDALLGEGRKYFFFASSDWHNRGQFGPFEPQSTLDAWPGEYQKIYVYTPKDRDDRAQAILEGMRKGNSYSVMGDLISKLYFVACYKGDCATMGETLRVPRGAAGEIEFRVDVVDPEGQRC